jgi:hypothetical protein
MVTRFSAVDRRGADTIAILRYRAIPPLLSQVLHRTTAVRPGLALYELRTSKLPLSR